MDNIYICEASKLIAVNPNNCTITENDRTLWPYKGQRDRTTHLSVLIDDEQFYNFTGAHIHKLAQHTIIMSVIYKLFLFGLYYNIQKINRNLTDGIRIVAVELANLQCCK